jgi:hypothetical protein
VFWLQIFTFPLFHLLPALPLQVLKTVGGLQNEISDLNTKIESLSPRKVQQTGHLSPSQQLPL